MLTKLDELYLPQHWYLSPADECYFCGEYTAHRGYAHSETNSLIFNLKKGIEKRGLHEWKYKTRAIRDAAKMFRESLREEFIQTATFVPVPPSKASNHHLYDDRIVQVIRCLGSKVDLRELVYQRESTEDVHTASERLGPNELYDNYCLQEGLLVPTPVHIAIVDDVLTTGAHFIAIKRLLNEAFPDVRIVGLFVARRVPED